MVSTPMSYGKATNWHCKLSHDDMPHWESYHVLLRHWKQYEEQSVGELFSHVSTSAYYFDATLTNYNYFNPYTEPRHKANKPHASRCIMMLQLPFRGWWVYFDITSGSEEWIWLGYRSHQLTNHCFDYIDTSLVLAKSNSFSEMRSFFSSLSFSSSALKAASSSSILV